MRKRHLPAFKSLRLSAVAIAVAATAALSGCSAAEKPSLYIVLADRSGSLLEADGAAFKESTAAIVSEMRARQIEAEADRLVVAPIDDQPFTRFRLLLDVSITTDGSPNRDQMIEDQRKKISSDIGLIHDGQKVKSTRILDAIVGAAELIEVSPNYSAQLLIFSDMIEEGPAANFAKDVPDEAATEALLDHLRAVGLVPDLKGAEVLVIGAGGADAEAFVKIEYFWRRYVEEANGKLVRYTRVSSGL